jgi:cell division protein FtsL
MMAASQRRYKAKLPTEPAWPVQDRGPDRSHDKTLKQKAAGRRRRFAMLVVVPVLLMLGSVYLHTVAAGLDARAAELDVKLDRGREKRERLEVRVAELSGAGRIRALASEKLGMHEPKSAVMKVYRDKGEDGTNNGKPRKGGRPRQR